MVLSEQFRNGGVGPDLLFSTSDIFAQGRE
jgi:hypothetical protein